MTAATAGLCAVALAARPSPPWLIGVWCVSGASGGFCAGLGFAFIVRQLRLASLPQFGPTARTTAAAMTAGESRARPHGSPLSNRSPAMAEFTDTFTVAHDFASDGNGADRDWIYASADLGWTAGLILVMALDASQRLSSDFHYLLAAGVPIVAAVIVGFWAHHVARRSTPRFGPLRTALAMLAGLGAGIALVQAWVGLADLLCWLVALVVAVHLAVSLTSLVNLAAWAKPVGWCEKSA